MMFIDLALMLLAVLLFMITLPGVIELSVLTASAVYAHLGTVKNNEIENVPDRTVPLVVVVPAHDEAQGIATCIESIQKGLALCRNCDLIVIADNCTDKTAEAAEATGARVLVRNNQQQRGKGYALNFAFEILMAEGYEGFLVIDADSRIDEALIAEIQRMLKLDYDAVQCRYQISNPTASPRARLQKIAWLAFNDLRLMGREALGLSVGILGNGFALSRNTLTAVPYDAGSIAEDLEYHLRLVRSGRRVHFLDSVSVYSDAPSQGQVAAVQRSRWEGGRFRLIAEEVPELFSSVLQGRFMLLEPMAELLLLPLAYHVVLLLAGLLLPLIWIQLYAAFALLLVILHIAAATWVNGGGWRDLSILAAAPIYILWKLFMLPQILRSSSKKASWKRTDRDMK